MKKTALILAALGAAMAAQAQEPTSTYSVTTDFSYTSKYVFRGLEVADESFQGSVEMSVGDLYAGIWTNQPITKNQDNEIDLYTGYKWKMTENLSFEGVATYYWYPEAESEALKHSEEVGIGANYLLRGISTSVFYYYDFKLEAHTLQGSIGYSVPLETIGASLDVTGYYGIADVGNIAPWEPVATSESYSYYGVDVSLPYKLSEQATFTLAGHWASNAKTPTDTEGDHLWWTAGLTVGF